MKFIKVTDKSSGEIRFLSISTISEICIEQNGNIFIVVCVDKRYNRRGFYVNETLFEIEEQLRKAGAL